MLSYLQTTTPAGGRLDLYTSGKWVPVIAAQNLTVAPITSSDNVEVTIGHKKMSGGGISFFADDTPANDLISATRPFQMGGGTVRGDTTGLTVKSTGAASAKLTTNATNLVVDKGITAVGTSSFLNVNITGTTTINDATIDIDTLTIHQLLTISQISLGAMSTASGDRAARKDYVDTQVGTRLTQAAADARYLNKTGDTITGYFHMQSTSGPTVRVSSTNNEPYIDFFSGTFTTQLGYIQCTATAMNIITIGTKDIVLNAGGGQIRTSDPVYANGGLRGWAYGPVLRLLGYGSNVYQEWFGGGSNIDTPGGRYGWMGFNASGHLQMVNECTDASIFLRTAYGIIFQAGGEQMRVIPGEAMLGKTSSNLGLDGIELHTNGTIYVTRALAGGATMYMNRINSVSSNYFIGFYRNGSEVGSIRQNGTTAVLYTTQCDYRAKNVLGPVTGALARVMKLRPQRAIYHGEEEEVDSFTAHELAEIAPYAVSGVKDGEGMQGGDYGRIAPLLVAAIQEMQAEIAALRAAA